jgi:hypothetical protein
VIDERGVGATIGSSICQDDREFSMTDIRHASMIAQRLWFVPPTTYEDQLDYFWAHKNQIRDNCGEGAFRIVARELFFEHAPYMLDALWKLFGQVTFDPDDN